MEKSTKIRNYWNDILNFCRADDMISVESLNWNYREFMHKFYKRRSKKEKINFKKEFHENFIDTIRIMPLKGTFDGKLSEKPVFVDLNLPSAEFIPN